jgi:Protein of unknown function (DUF1194)
MGQLFGRAISSLSMFCSIVLMVLASSSAPLIAQSSGAADNRVDVALVLAVDASGSVDDDRFELQKHGFAAAFRNQKVLAAIRAGDHRAISILMVQWTGPTQQEVMVPWTYVSDEFSAGRAAAAIEAAPRRLMGGGTSISGAIDFSVKMLAGSPYRATRRVIDISGDGANNIGRPAEQARDEAVRLGIRINGLPILTVEPDLDQYYRKNVIGGPGAFAIVAKTYDQYADAILRKLVTEISQDQQRHYSLANNNR